MSERSLSLTNTQPIYALVLPRSVTSVLHFSQTICSKKGAKCTSQTQTHEVHCELFFLLLHKRRCNMLVHGYLGKWSLLLQRWRCLCVQRSYSADLGYYRWIFELLLPLCGLQPVCPVRPLIPGINKPFSSTKLAGYYFLFGAILFKLER